MPVGNKAFVLKPRVHRQYCHVEPHKEISESELDRARTGAIASAGAAGMVVSQHGKDCDFMDFPER